MSCQNIIERIHPVNHGHGFSFFISRVFLNFLCKFPWVRWVSLGGNWVTDAKSIKVLHGQQSLPSNYRLVSYGCNNIACSWGCDVSFFFRHLGLRGKCFLFFINLCPVIRWQLNRDNVLWREVCPSPGRKPKIRNSQKYVVSCLASRNNILEIYMTSQEMGHFLFLRKNLPEWGS